MDNAEKLRILLEENMIGRFRREVIREFYRYYVFLDPPEIDT